MTFKKGQRVAILNQTLSGRILFEGWAKVMKRLGDQYIVRFEEDCDEAVRFIDPAAQADPEGFVNRLYKQVNAT